MAQKEATLLLRIKQVGQDVLDRVVFTFGDLVNMAKALGDALAEPIRAFREKEKAANALNQALVNRGIYTAKLSAEYQAMAARLQETTTFEDDAIVSAQALLQAQIGQLKITEELTTSVLNLAQAKGMDLASAADIVGKSIGSSTNALARHGIAVDENATKQEKMASVIEQLNKKFGGQAAAAAKGLGVLDQLKNISGEFAENIGEKLAPLVEIFTRRLLGMVQAANSADSVFVTMQRVAIEISKAFDWIATRTTEVFGIIMPGIFAAFGAAIENFAQGQFKQGLQAFKDVEEQTAKDVEASKAAHLERMKQYDEIALTSKADTQKREVEMLRQSESNKQAMAAENHAIESENRALRNETELLEKQTHLDALNALEITAQLQRINELLLNEQDATTKFALENKKKELNSRITNEELKKSEEALYQFRREKRAAELRDQETFFNTASTLSQAKSKELAAIGKAAAITQIAIKTPEAVAGSYAFGARIGGPILGNVFGGIAAAAMAAQAARVAGVQLAEGGIVRARPGGVQATIGEGGHDEAVIPLDSPEAASRLGGGGTVINFYGAVLGDKAQAREFAIVIDRELLNLRRDGESLAFDSRIS